AGQTFNVEASQYDVAKSDEATHFNGAQVFAIGGANTPQTTNTQPQQGLGSQIKLRKLPAGNTPPPPPATSSSPAPSVATGSAALSTEVLQKFDRAYENVGIFEHKVISSGAHSIRCDLTADSE